MVSIWVLVLLIQSATQSAILEGHGPLVSIRDDKLSANSLRGISDSQLDLGRNRKRSIEEIAASHATENNCPICLDSLALDSLALDSLALDSLALDSLALDSLALDSLATKPKELYNWKKCGHRYHLDCIEKWVQARPETHSCPICRRKLNGDAEAEGEVEGTPGSEPLPSSSGQRYPGLDDYGRMLEYQQHPSDPAPWVYDHSSSAPSSSQSPPVPSSDGQNLNADPGNIAQSPSSSSDPIEFQHEHSEPSGTEGDHHWLFDFIFSSHDP